MTANNSISLAQFDYAVKFEEEYREAIASGGWVTQKTLIFFCVSMKMFARIAKAVPVTGHYKC